MAFTLTPTTRSLNQRIEKQPTLIVEIEGSDILYGTSTLLQNRKWDDPSIDWDQEGITWDGKTEIENSKSYISFKQSTKSITQQLIIEKGGSGSISTMDIAFVDFNTEVATDLSFDNLTDVLGKKAKVYMGLEGGSHPEDSIPIFIGFVDDVKYQAGLVIVSVSHPENLKRQPIYEQYQAQTTAAIDAVVTNIPVTTTNQFIPSDGNVTSYIQIDDEVMEVVAVNTGSFDVVRSALGTFPATHDTDADVNSFYRMQGNPLDLALKIMHSNDGNTFTDSELKIKSINEVGTGTEIVGALLIDDIDAETTTGLVIGDIIEISGSTFNDGQYPIQSFSTLDSGESYIVVDALLITEPAVNLTLSYKSQFNVLNEGLGLDVDQVDTQAFLDVLEIFAANFIDYDMYIKDTIDNAKEFIDGELFLPQGIYTIPRKAKISCKFTSPPFSIDTIPVLNTTNLENITGIQMRRSVHKYLFNEVIFRYNEQVLEDRLLDKVIRIDSESIARIKSGRRVYGVDARGIRRSAESLQVLERLSERILGRYKFAARYITNVKTTLEVGLNLEIGDIVFFGGDDTQLTNIQTGARDMPVTQYEIINKRLDIFKGAVTLELLETGFALDGLFGVFSPSSTIVSGSTASKILLSAFFPQCNTDAEERNKWENYIGGVVRVRSEDYTFDETTTIQGFDNITNNGIILNPPLSSAPPADSIIELSVTTDYENDTDIDQLVRTKYTFNMPASDITAVTSSTEFDLEDVGGFTVGMEIKVHTDDYTQESISRFIDSIVGNTITLDSALDFVPQIGDQIEVFAYADAKGYRFL